MKKIKCGLVAFLLSLIVPGLGQIYNGQLWAGLILVACYFSFAFAAGMSRILHSFVSAVFYAIFIWIYGLTAATYAASVAIRQVRNDCRPRQGWRFYSLATLLFCGLALMFSSGTILGVRGYVAPSDSMSPTMVAGDRFAVDVKYYKTHRPNRGDIIAFRMPANGGVYVKRVVAIGGDTIAGDFAGTILNGQRITEPYLLRASNQTPNNYDPEYGTVHLGPGQLFVMGDNRAESLDSRSFGPSM